MYPALLNRGLKIQLIRVRLGAKWNYLKEERLKIEKLFPGVLR